MDALKIKKVYGIEITLLILISRVFLKTATIDSVENFILNNSIDWERVYALSSCQRIRPMVFKVLLPLKENVAVEVFLKFRSFCILFSTRTLKREQEALRIISILSEKGVPAKLYKGIDFARFAYTDVYMREFSDIDVIVSKDDLHSLIGVMKAEGYKMTGEEFFEKFPAQYYQMHKDICFTKPNAQWGAFCFEFHYMPTKKHVDFTLDFPGLLGTDYLEPNTKFDSDSYFKLMLISNGVTDYFPNLRSLIDLALVFTEREIESEFQVFKQLWLQLSLELFNFPANYCHYENNQACKIILHEILKKKKKARLSFVTITYLNVLTSHGLKKKWKFFFRRLSIIFIPTNEDIETADLPFFFPYHFIKIKSLINKYVLRLEKK